MDEEEEEKEEKKGQPKKTAPKKAYVVSGGLLGFGVAQDLLNIDFSPPEEAPDEFRAMAFNEKKVTTLKSGKSGGDPQRVPRHAGKNQECSSCLLVATGHSHSLLIVSNCKLIPVVHIAVAWMA